MNCPMSQFKMIDGRLCMLDMSRYDRVWGFWKVVRA